MILSGELLFSVIGAVYALTTVCRNISSVVGASIGAEVGSTEIGVETEVGSTEIGVEKEVGSTEVGVETIVDSVD